MDWLDNIEQVWALILQAPKTFVSLAVGVLGFGWLVGRFMFSERISTLEGRIEAYKEKLGDAPPNEIAAKLAELEKKIEDLHLVIPPIEDVQRFGDSEARARHKLVGKIIRQWREHTGHNSLPADAWLNARLAEHGVNWRARWADTHYETGPIS